MKNTPDGDLLKSYVQRIANLHQQKREIQEDIKDIYVVVKSAGYDPKIVRSIIKRMEEDPQKRAEREELIQIYLDALGEFARTPLGMAAMDKL
jgi:uncharacterized protein (UPF0335 family)